MGSEQRTHRQLALICTLRSQLISTTCTSITTQTNFCLFEPTAIIQRKINIIIIIIIIIIILHELDPDTPVSTSQNILTGPRIVKVLSFSLSTPRRRIGGVAV